MRGLWLHGPVGIHILYQVVGEPEIGGAELQLPLELLVLLHVNAGLIDKHVNVIVQPLLEQHVCGADRVADGCVGGRSSPTTTIWRCNRACRARI